MCKISDSDFVSVFAEVKEMAQRWKQIGIFERDDLVQNTMLKVLARAEERKPTRTWLFMTLRSAGMDAVRATSKEHKYELADKDLSVSELIDLKSSSCSMPAEFEVDSMPALNERLAALSPEQRQILSLCAEGCTYGQIAEVTNVGIGTVRSRLSYARLNAQKLVSDFV